MIQQFYFQIYTQEKWTFIAAWCITAQNWTNFHPQENGLYDIDNGILLLEKKWPIDTCNELDKSQKHHAEQNEPDTTYCVIIYVKANGRQK